MVEATQLYHPKVAFAIRVIAMYVLGQVPTELLGLRLQLALHCLLRLIDCRRFRLET